MGEPEAASGAARLRFLTFRVDERLYALPAGEVTEVIRTPAVARVPQAPGALLGLANLRGEVLPVATARGLLGKPERGSSTSDRTIVLDTGAAAGLAVDVIEGLIAVEPGRFAADQTELAAEAGEKLAGAIRPEGGTEVVRVLDIRSMLQGAFASRARPQRSASAPQSIEGPAVETDAVQRLVTFEVAGQGYGLPLDSVREIIAAPDEVTAAAGAEAVLVGLIPYRDTLLPLLSLRQLLGFDLPKLAGDGAKVLVTWVGNSLVGLVADQARAVISAEAGALEPAPPMLAARTGGEARVDAIYRSKTNGRLVSILAPAKLFREDVMARLTGALSSQPKAALSTNKSGEQRQYVVFRLGSDEFGLPVEAVDEVARAPETVARVPKTPKFLEGVINLRGEVLPVVDQRRRFDMPPSEDLEARRLIVLRTQRHRAGVIVDSVAEVLRCSPDDIGEAPNLPGETNRLVNGVLNLPDKARLVMLLDPAELLTRAEIGMLDEFKPKGGKAGV